MKTSDIFSKVPTHWIVAKSIVLNDVEYNSCEVNEEAATCETCEFACCDENCISSAKLSPCVQRVDDNTIKVFVWRKNGV